MLDKSEEERYRDWLYESEKKIILPAKTIVLLVSFAMLYFLNREFFFSPLCLYFFLFCLLFRPYFLGYRICKRLFYRHYLKVSFTSFIWDALFLVIVICLTGGVRSPLTLVLYAMIIRGAVSYFPSKRLFFSGMAVTFLCWMIGLFLIEKNFLFLQEPFLFSQIALFWILSLTSTFAIATLAKEKKALQKSEKSLRSIFDTIGGLLFMADSETKSIRRVNQTALEILGYTREELRSMTMLDLYPIGRHQEIVGIFQEIIEGRRRFYSIPLLTKKGRLLPVETRVSLGYYEGRPVIIGISRDITERKKVEESLKESEARYRALLKASADGIFIADSETRKFKYANLAFCKTLGYREEELKGMGIDDIHPTKDSLLRVISKLAVLEGRERTSVLDIPCLRKDGAIIYADINITTALIDGRKCYVGIVREITERKKAEEVLRASEQRSRAIFDGVTDGLLLVDIETKKFYLSNKMICRMLGYNQKEIKNLGVTDIHLKEDLSYVMEQFEKQSRGEITLAKDIPVKRKDGSIFYADVNSAPIILAKKIYLISIFRDVTERKELQEQLIQSVKMASLGTLASGVSHEIRNPLSIIIQGIEHLKSSISPDALLLDSIMRIKKAALRANKIVKDLLDFSRQRPPEWVKLDIFPIIEETLSLIKYHFNLKNIKIIRQFASLVPKVEIDSDQISQVFLNILLNAVDAMPKGGTITIRLEQIRIKGRKKYLQIAFIDTGCGIPKDEIQKVFDPFFSTKKKEGGVGLGLSVTRGIVEGHKGTIRIESQVGKGTKVIIGLPLAR